MLQTKALVFKAKGRKEGEEKERKKLLPEKCRDKVNNIPPHLYSFRGWMLKELQQLGFC